MTVDEYTYFVEYEIEKNICDMCGNELRSPNNTDEDREIAVAPTHAVAHLSCASDGFTVAFTDADYRDHIKWMEDKFKDAMGIPWWEQ
jgi:hypothetical protein